MRRDRFAALLPIRTSRASGRQTLGRGSIRRRHSEQVGYRHIQRIGERLNDADGDVLFSALDPTRVGPVDIDNMGQTLLRETTLNAQPPQVPAKQIANPHRRTRPELPKARRRTQRHVLTLRRSLSCINALTQSLR